MRYNDCIYTLLYHPGGILTAAVLSSPYSAFGVAWRIPQFFCQGEISGETESLQAHSPAVWTTCTFECPKLVSTAWSTSSLHLQCPLNPHALALFSNLCDICIYDIYILVLTWEGKCAGSSEFVIWGANLPCSYWPASSLASDIPYLAVGVITPAGSQSTYLASLSQGNRLVGQWDTAGVWCAPGSWFLRCSSWMIPENTSCCPWHLCVPGCSSSSHPSPAHECTGGSGGCGSMCRSDKWGVVWSTQRILSQGTARTGV